jgi:chemotaxis protein MotA
VPNAVWTGLLVVAVSASIVVEVFFSGSGAVAATSGFCLVFCGTLLMARLSYSLDSLRLLRASIAETRMRRGDDGNDELRLQSFLKAASFFRYGNIRPAEEAARSIPRPVLRRGTQLVLDGLQRPQLAIALQRQIAEERERLASPVDLLRAMAGYAPTLGMLGTLLGLSQMLFGVSSGDLKSMGSSMGFAMTTTVYGLVLANLIFKPLASRIEQRNRLRLTQSIVDLQAVMLLYERQHPEYIREVIMDTRTDTRAAGAPYAELVRAAG